MMEEPTIQIPLCDREVSRSGCESAGAGTYQPAPITLSPMLRAIPVRANAYGLVCSRKDPTLN